MNTFWIMFFAGFVIGGFATTVIIGIIQLIEEEKSHSFERLTSSAYRKLCNEVAYSTIFVLLLITCTYIMLSIF